MLKGSRRGDGRQLSHPSGATAAIARRLSALLPVYAQFPIRPVRGHGSWLVDEDGNEWLDAYGGHAVASTGHSPSRRGARDRRAGGDAALLLDRGAAPASRASWPSGWPRSVPIRWAGCSSATRARRRTRTPCTWPGSAPAGRRSSRCSAAGTAAPRRRSPAPTARATRTARGAARHPALAQGAGRRRGRARGRRWTTAVAAVIMEPVQGLSGARDLSADFLARRPPGLRRARRGAHLRRGPVRRGPLRRVQRRRGGAASSPTC